MTNRLPTPLLLVTGAFIAALVLVVWSHRPSVPLFERTEVAGGPDAPMTIVKSGSGLAPSQEVPSIPVGRNPGSIDPGLGTQDQLASILARVPKGKEDEWGISQLRPGQATPDWIREVVRAKVGPLYMDEPPFRVDLAFGRSDEEWFSEFNAGLQDDMTRAGTSALSEEVLAKYCDSLRMTAARRIRESAVISKWLSDSTPLRDLEPKSRQAEWLLAMIGVTTTSALWEGQSLGTSERDTWLLSALDLPMMSRWRRQIYASTIDVGIDISSPRARELVRPVAEQFNSLVESRR